MRFDVIVVGAGHAGAEAAAAAAGMGASTALLTFTPDQIGRLSCNPAMGGLAKGTLVREIDALGGLMARLTDATTIQFRKLNTRKGLAVQASRAQVDVTAYPAAVRAALEGIPGLELIFGEVADLVVEDGSVAGVELADGRKLASRSVVLTTGTFLGGVLHCGADRRPGGRIDEPAATRLATRLRDLGLPLLRLKTGTPPRLHKDSIDWSGVELQGDEGGHFGFGPPPPRIGSVTVGITGTSPETHRIIAENLHLSAMYSGAISGTGPRYCPSIEDKIQRFAERERHLLFLEPEGLDTPRVYVNGTSTSLPAPVQERMIHSIGGLESARILQYGYAVEYDCIDPRSLDAGLMLRALPGLWCAGQLNGTSGYEEAAAQGLIAGINAALAVQGAPPFVLARHEAMIGVMIDDLVSRGVGGEPYRMFPSRAEHRLTLREDNADRRLMERGYRLGLLPSERWLNCRRSVERGDELRAWVKTKVLTPDSATQARLALAGLPALSRNQTVEELLRRPEVEWRGLARLFPEFGEDEAASAQVEVDVKYAGYLGREQTRRDAAIRLESISIQALDFRSITALSTECRERLERARPATLGAAARLPGVTPAALDVLAMVAVRSRV